MGKVKMSQMIIEGSVEHLDSVLMACTEGGAFQVANNAALSNNAAVNPYSAVRAKVYDMAAFLKIAPQRCDFGYLPYDTAEEFWGYYDKISKRYNEICADYERVTKSLEEHKNTQAYLKHLSGLTASFQDLAELKYVKARIGRMPLESEQKLQYFAEKCFIFHPLEHEEDFVYGVYLVPISMVEFVDSIMETLMFEPADLPQYLSDNAQFDGEKLAEQIAAEEEDKIRLENELSYFTDEAQEELLAVMCKLKYKEDCFELRRLVMIVDGRFCFSGYCPTKKRVEIRRTAKAISKSIRCVEV